jgi:hypothetical protein
MSLRRGLVPVAIAILIALVYWPGLHGFWTRDDFMQLAFARLVGSPWPIFAHDHYVAVPGSIFRPLGFASFWLWQALFGTGYFANALGDLLLHVAVGLALYRVIRFGRIDRVPAALCTLIFALHPAVLGTALWWSARFDVLAMLFGLIAVRAGLDHAERPRAGSLPVALLALLAALLSKETALAAAGAIGLVWLRACWIDAPRRGPMLRALAALAALVVLFFAWRTAVLGTATTGLANGASLVDAIGRGVAGWVAHLAGYAMFWPRSGMAVRVILLAAIIVAAGALRVRRRNPDSADPLYSPCVDLAICGLCLFALPAVLQAPIAGMNATPLRADVSVVEAAMQSRLYYVSFGGLAIVLAAGVGRAFADARTSRALLTAALVVAVGAFGWVSHDAATGFAARTAAQRAMAEAASAAIDRAAAVAGARCRIVVLGVEPPTEWSIYVSMDSVAKALSADVDRVGRCFVHADYVTYFNLMRGDATAADALPYTPRVVDGRPLAWPRVGDLTTAYVDAPAAPDAAALAGIVFLRYENGAFVDVTNEVTSGRLPVTLR